MSPFSFCKAIVIIILFHFSSVNACLKDERGYLLDFRGRLNDFYGRLRSWQQFNCCQWEGVICDYHSGHVVSLDLKNRNLRGVIHPSLFNLQHLQYLDLSWNDFNGFPIPPELGKLQRLTFLNLAYASFGGEIPLELGNITTLRHLDLRNSYLESRRFAGWIRSLRSLEYLDMSDVNLSMASWDWGNALSSLSNLTEIHLSNCGLSGTIPSFLNLTHLSQLDLSWNSFSSSSAWFQNVTSMVSLDLSRCGLNGSIPSNFLHRSSPRNLDLSYNNLGGVIPDSIANFSMLETLSLSRNNLTGDLTSFGSFHGRLSFLEHLDLSYNHFLSGTIPYTISELSSLSSLDLSHNHLSGTIPYTISELSSLSSLDLSNNQLSGTIPHAISNLSSLRSLKLSNNQLSGTIPHAMSKFLRLERLLLDSNNLTGSISPSVLEIGNLKEVDFSENQLTLNISPSWSPQFVQLEYLGLRSCNIQGEIPAFLCTQFSLMYVDLSDNNIVGNIPTWLWDLPNLRGLNLSHNELEGSLPPVISEFIDFLDLHDNSLDGSIPDYSGYILDMSGNRFNGSIPRFTCSAYGGLTFLDLSKNGLTGVIPTDLVRCSLMFILNLAQNYLEGEMPKWLGNLTGLQTLNLGGNKLEGVISPSIAHCTQLRVFDIENNRIHGNIPVWIGKLAELRILNLAFNKLQGTFPPELLSLKNLQILDLSQNNLSGVIPENLGKLNAMVDQSQSDQIEMISGGAFGFTDISSMFQIIFVNQVTLWMKGRATEYPKILSAFKFMDLSQNKLSGNIPEEMGDLKGLIALNISNNNLRGKIPESLGGMAQLESLDLSGNVLSGNIPADLVNLTFLEVLNLSYNNLSGLIPRGKQFATFEASSYVGNPNLHGWPLENGTLRSRPDEGGKSNSTGVADRDADEVDRWWAVSVGLCFGVGFASVIAVLCFHLKWRYRCFALLDGFIHYLFEH